MKIIEIITMGVMLGIGAFIMLLMILFIIDIRRKK